MQILDGYNDYSWQKELKVLMKKMANLSKYQPMIFDSIFKEEEERKAFNKAQEDYDLFKAALLYIFSWSVYSERMTTVFKDLTYKERSNFYAYYKSSYEKAVNHGFLTEYVQVLQGLNSGLSWYFEQAIFWGFLFFTYDATNSFFVTLVCYIVLSYLSDITRKLYNPSSEQMDLIIRKLYDDQIDRNLDWAKKLLIEAGWLDEEGDIVVPEEQ